MVKKNKKYNVLVGTARELFWKHGFRRVSIEEICKKSGVSKMTFYKYFPNKLELAKTVFNLVINEGMQKWDELIQAPMDGAEKIKKLVLMKAEGTHDISREFMQDFYTNAEPELNAFVEKRIREMWGNILNDFKKAQQDGIFRSDFKPEFLLFVSFKMIESLKDEQLAGLYGSPQELILEFANFVAYGISPRE
jgi:AcrR family transcriptional regulator